MDVRLDVVKVDGRRGAALRPEGAAALQGGLAGDGDAQAEGASAQAGVRARDASPEDEQVRTLVIREHRHIMHEGG